ncbi:MAG: alanyl-tRNA editing protein [Candidatus Heimdallarchaeota archaeon]|nr:MAG: alanyl-tRNA editing protein [Candidatus Heimdallarchaeota archaeon]
MTERLYLVDCYIQDFAAIIKEILPTGIILDRSAFYPESGGQLGDQGKLKTENLEIIVKNTRQQRGKLIHEVETIEGLEVGIEIKGELNWVRRYQMMRAHTAQHCISRFFQINYSAETVSNKLKTSINRIDLSPLSKLSLEELNEIAAQINKLISSNMPVSISFLPRKEAINFLRDKEYQTQYLGMVPKSVKEFRIISINNYDWAACAGTHVQNTSEIGYITFEKTVNKGKLRERIYYSVS